MLINCRIWLAEEMKKLLLDAQRWRAQLVGKSRCFFNNNFDYYTYIFISDNV